MLTEVFGWFGDIARGIVSVLPQRRIVRCSHGAVVYGPRGGLRVLAPGWYVIWPLFQEFEDFPVMRQTENVPNQPLVTLDGKTVTAGGLIRYSVRNVEQFCVLNLNTFEDIVDVAQIAIRDVVISNTFATLQEDRLHIDDLIRRNAQRRLKSYGVKVHDLNLKGLAPAQLLHLISDSRTPVLVPTETNS